MWRATANNGLCLLTASSGTFSNNTTSIVVGFLNFENRRPGQVNDLVIDVGFDSDSDGLLENDEVLISFQNVVIGSQEYEDCYSQLLNAYGNSSWGILPISNE